MLVTVLSFPILPEATVPEPVIDRVSPLTIPENVEKFDP